MSEVKSEENNSETGDLDTAEVVLVVEDSPANSRILSHIIRQMGCEVIEAGNGEVALSKIKELPPQKKLIGVFSDIMMPTMDGLAFLEQIRQSPDLSELFFVFVTAVVEATSVVKAKNLKVNGYLLKPVTTDKVRKALTAMSRHVIKR